MANKKIFAGTESACTSIILPGRVNESVKKGTSSDRNEGAGKNMNWFWKAWYFDNSYPDLMISNVKLKQKQVTIEAKGSKPIPIDLTIFYSDNTTQQIHRSVAVWEKGNKTVDVLFSSSKPVIKIVLGNFYDADINKDNNVWVNK